ncbi:acylphosphatase [Parachitinimonas caeni]|uniref:acylphosphatase n=1 Tax=Parachitinimonas caeni TaxID=3031301 RepID=A0ABT7E441_9NEIS|nr:acylphosphatase [Parachitinimonas caeni]MDK2126175.1 acylphosphatase [Parachitinimonas caeni]
MTEARRLIVIGRVQGVGYRNAFEMTARRYGLAGWVRNRLDGTVEAWVEGETNSVASIIDWAAKGPPAARVDDIEVLRVEPAGLQTFVRKETV